MERFFRYSLERERAIRLIITDENGKLRQLTAIVTAIEADAIKVYVLRPPKDLTIPIASILSADYRKGDEGGE